MKIWFFDTGSGGYYTMMQCKKLMPYYDYCFFADTKHLPFGDKTPEQIQEYTFAWIERLFEQWSALVILACNTAAANSVRKRQALYPDKKVLSVTIPLVESLISSNPESIWMLATQATINSGILEDLFEKGWYSKPITYITCPGLADAIEKSLVRNNWIADITVSTQEQVQILKSYIPDNLNVDSVGLACTHYGLRMEAFKQLLPHIKILDTADIVPQALSDYLYRHPEIEQRLSRGGTLEEVRSI